jgi:methionine salvage enolase-phosphatase E1
MGTIPCYKSYVYLLRAVGIQKADILFEMSVVVNELEAEWRGSWEEQQAPDCCKPESIL